MTLKPCSGCNLMLTTRNVKSHGQSEGLLYVSCLACRSTNAIASQKLRNELDIYEMAMEDNARVEAELAAMKKVG